MTILSKHTNEAYFIVIANHVRKSKSKWENNKFILVCHVGKMPWWLIIFDNAVQLICALLVYVYVML